MTPDRVGKLIKCINNLIMRNASLTDSHGRMKEITPMQGWIMGYLYFHRDDVIYQKTLETEFGVPKSTLATMLRQLGDKGYILREAAEHDTRLKKIYLSEKGCKLQTSFINNFQQIDTYMCQGIAEEDLEIFLKVGNKIKNNLESRLCEKNTRD